MINLNTIYEKDSACRVYRIPLTVSMWLKSSLVLIILLGLSPNMATAQNSINCSACNSNDSYSNYVFLMPGLLGGNSTVNNNYWLTSGGCLTFTRNDNGTATLTGQIVNKGNSNYRFNVNVNYSGGYQSGSLYKYSSSTGTLTGTNGLIGGVLHISDTGADFSTGHYANPTSTSTDGGVGWYNWSIGSHPYFYNGVYFSGQIGYPGDINISFPSGCSATINPCSNQGGDNDNDGVCANEDCDDNNPDFPATPGSSCNDGNPNTTNDVVTADGCGCEGTPVSGCDNVNNGGQIGGDQTVCAGDAAATLTTVSAPTGGAGAIEYIWLSSTSGCPTNLNQTIAGATAATYNPGTLSQTTYFVRCSRRAGCSDWNVGESNCVTVTVDHSSNCGGGGGGGEPDCADISITTGTGSIIVSGLDGAPVSSLQIFNSSWQQEFSCFANCSATETVNLPSGDYHVYAKYYTAAYTLVCQEAQTVTVSGGGCSDADNDGTCDTDDCQPNNPAFPATPGSSCNDGNPNTTNDVVTADGCGCEGTPVSGCDNVNNGGQIGGDQTVCAGDAAATLTTVSAPTGGAGAIEYIWLSSTSECPTSLNQTIAGATAATYNPGTLSQTTYFVRCSRRAGCSDWNVGESNCVTVTVDNSSNCGGGGGGGGGEPDCADISITTGTGSIIVSGLDGAPVSSLQIFNSSWQQEFSCFANCSATETVNLPSGDYHVYAKYYTAAYTLVCQEAQTVTVSGGGCSDADNDGTCDTDDCQPNNPAFPATPGSSCNDGNPNTTNDVVTADGCGCEGTPVSGCDNVNNGGQIGGDQTVCAGDAAATLTTVSAPTGGAGAIEYIWLSSTSGCPTSLNQTIAGATAATYNPGTLSQTTYFVRCSRRAGCSDWNAGESNCVTVTVDHSSNCGGGGGGGEPDCADISITTGTGSIIVSGLDGAPVSSLQIFNSSWQQEFSCFANCSATETVNLPSGDYHVYAKYYTAAYTLVCQEAQTVTVSGGGCSDADNDGTCDTDDCQPNNPAFPATPGSSCNDGNPNTTNDVVTADGCGCEGTPVSGCDNVNNGGQIGGDQTVCAGDAAATLTTVSAPTGGAGAIEYIWLSSTSGCPTSLNQTIAGATAATYNPGTLSQTTYFVRCSRRAGCSDWNVGESNCVTVTVDNSSNCGGGGGGEPDCADISITTEPGKIIVSGLDGAPVSSLQIFNSSWQQEFSCFADCNAMEMVDLPAGTYYVYAKYYTASYTLICQANPTITVEGGGCTDNDNDGVCANQDCDDNNPNLPATPGTSCNDGNPNTINDVIQGDGCSCNGIFDACATAGGDNDNDGVCANQDCDDNNPNLPATPGTSCNDGNPNTINDVIQGDGCSCNGIFDACATAGGDNDNDGVCANQDCDDNNPNLPATPGTSCNDGNPNTINDVIQGDGCSCNGIFDACATAGGDNDNDGVCANQDCDDNNPNLPATPGTSCNDGNPNTINDVIQGDGCSCEGTLPSQNCSNTELVHWDLNACVISFSDPDPYSEFTPSTNSGSCANVTATNVYRSITSYSGHSCAPGLNGTSAMCVSSRDDCSFQNNADKSVYFEVTLSPGNGQVASLGKLEFYENAPLYYEFTSGLTGLNNYAEKYGIRVTVNGQQVFKQSNINTTGIYSLESFDFSNDPDFTVSTTTTFKFQLLPYCTFDNGSNISAWELEDIRIFGCCSDDYQPLVATNNSTNTQANQWEGHTEIEKTQSEDLIDFTLFPNPANDYVKVDLEALIGSEVDIHFYNSLGQRVKAVRLDEVYNKFYQIDINDLQNGHYNVWIQSPNKRPVAKALVIGRF